MAMHPVEVIYAPMAHVQWHVHFDVMQGTTVAGAVAQSGLYQAYPELENSELSLGVYAKLVSPEQVITGGERIEIYRALTADPKVLRQQRVLKKT